MAINSFKDKETAAAFAELQEQLGAGGPLAEASYVIVRELPAGDWGYGGLTQATRQADRQTARAFSQAR